MEQLRVINFNHVVIVIVDSEIQLFQAPETHGLSPGGVHGCLKGW
jgi:hypothetical protein